MLEVVLYAIEILEGMRRVLLCMPDDVEGGLCLLEVLEMLEVPDAMRSVLLSMLVVLEVLEVPEAMSCVLSVC